MIQCIISPDQVINQQPYNREKDKAYVKLGANYISFLYNIFSYKIKSDPGKYGCHAIA
jgi:hypothetical protein